MKAVIATIMFAFPALGWAIGYYPGKRVGFAGNEAREVMADWARSARSGRYEPAAVEIDLEARLRELRLPVLGLEMADDWFVPRASLDWLVGKLARCEVAKKTIRAGGSDGKADHYAWMKRPGRTAETIDEWLDPGPRASVPAR
jgi:predicted alpha/beta hydrolase